MKKKIHENAGKIKAAILAVLAIILTYMIFMLFDSDSYIRVWLKYVTIYSLIAFAPCFAIVTEIISVFLKGRAAVFLSIINIIWIIGAILLQCFILAVGLFASLVSGTSAGIPEAIIEIFMNILLCIGAGTILILNEQNELNKRSDVNKKLPLTKRIWKQIKHIRQIMKDNKKNIILIIKLLIAAGLVLMLINRIRTDFEEYSGKQYLFAIISFLLIPSEIVSLFLKGKPAAAVSIINVVIGFGITAIEGLIIGLVLFAAIWGRLQGDFTFYLGEFATNILLWIIGIGIMMFKIIKNKK